MTFHIYEENASGNPSSSFWDARREKGLDTLEIDISALRKLVDNTDDDYTPEGWKDGFLPSRDYNGIVYIELPQNFTYEERLDKITTSVDGMGVLLTNGSKVPDPDYNKQTGREEGFTLATNNTLYIQGNFNADGNSKTGSKSESDVAGNPDALAAVVADAVTLLSNDWDNSKSKGSKNNCNASYTEYNIAIIAGAPQSGVAGNKPATEGVHRLPRALEKWTGKSFRHRGALITLFASEISPEKFDATYCTPPTKEYGFFERFENGEHPPGIPKARTFKTTKLRYLTKSEYEEATKNL